MHLISEDFLSCFLKLRPVALSKQFHFQTSLIRRFLMSDVNEFYISSRPGRDVPLRKYSRSEFKSSNSVICSLVSGRNDEELNTFRRQRRCLICTPLQR